MDGGGKPAYRKATPLPERFDPYLETKPSVEFPFPIHQVVVIQKQAHRLTKNAKDEPEDHISHHRVSEFILQEICDQDKWYLEHNSDKSPQLEYVAGNSYA